MTLFVASTLLATSATAFGDDGDGKGREKDREDGPRATLTATPRATSTPTSTPTVRATPTATARPTLRATATATATATPGNDERGRDEDKQGCLELPAWASGSAWGKNPNVCTPTPTATSAGHATATPTATTAAHGTPTPTATSAAPATATPTVPSTVTGTPTLTSGSPTVAPATPTATPVTPTATPAPPTATPVAAPSARYSANVPTTDWYAGFGQTFDVSGYFVEIQNAGTQPWLSSGPNQALLAAHFVPVAAGTAGDPYGTPPGTSEAPSALWQSNVLQSLPADLAPNASARIPLTVTAPTVPGTYELHFRVAIGASKDPVTGVVTGGQWASTYYSVVVKVVVQPPAATATPSPVPAGAWTTMAARPSALGEASAAAIGNEIFVFGGAPGAESLPVSELAAYNTLTNTWRVVPLPSTPVARRDQAMVAVGSKLYVVGGSTGARTAGSSSDGTVLRTGDVIDTATGAVTALPPLQTERRGLVLVEIGGSLYALGGANNNVQAVAAVERLDLNQPGAVWTSVGLDPMLTPRWAAGGAVVNGMAYVFGGVYPSSGYLNTLERFNPAASSGQQWTARAGMPTPRRNLGGASAGGLLFAVGGVKTEGNTPNHEAYNPATDAWTRGLQMPTARRALTYVTLGTQIYAIGGFDANAGGLTTNERFTP